MSDETALQLAELSHLEAQHHNQRDLLNEEASKAAIKRNELNEEVAKLIEAAKTHQDARDECNKKVAELKIEKTNLEAQLEKNTTELSKLAETPENEPKKPQAKTSINVIRREIKSLEWKLQTTVLPIRHEKQLVNRVADLSQQYDDAKSEIDRQESLNQKNREQENIRHSLTRLHAMLRRTVKESQSHHLQMIELWKQVDVKKKEADKIHHEFLGLKEKADQEHKQVLEAREAIKNARNQLNQGRRQKEVEKQKVIQEQLETKTKSAYDKFKDGGKLTMEEFTLLVEKGLI